MGPCLCGDPYCPACGNPEQAKCEEAIEQAVQAFIDAHLTRAAVAAALVEYQAIQAEVEAAKPE